MGIPPASVEQLAVIIGLETANVIVDSVAGSGKTTTNLHIAKHFANDKILLLTYNKKLQLETKQRVKTGNITNLDIYTYHGFANTKYDGCFSDCDMLKLLNDDAMIAESFAYNIIILDESQDITPTLYRFICRVLLDNQSAYKLCLLGDKYQSIYGFNGADERYLTHADKLFNLQVCKNIGTVDPFIKVNLSTSYRLTDMMSGFLNDCIFQHQRINTVKSGAKIRYVNCDIYNTQVITNEFNLLKTAGYKDDDIFILAPSIKTSGNKPSPIRHFANSLAYMRNNIYIPASDDSQLDEKTLHNKVVFSSFHQAKGLERKAVILFGFDVSYFEYYNKTANPDVCPNELYVALTRAKERLIILHHYDHESFSFLDKTCIDNYCEMIETAEFLDDFGEPIDREFEALIANTDIVPVAINLLIERPAKHYDLFGDEITDADKINENETKDKPVKKPAKPYHRSATNMLKFVPVDIICKCLDLIKITIINPPGTMIKIPTTVFQNRLYENVADLTGVAIPAYYEYKNTGRMTILTSIKEIRTMNRGQLYRNLFQAHRKYIDDIIVDTDANDIDENIDKNNTNNNENNKKIGVGIDIYNTLKLANFYNYSITGLLYRLRQIFRYYWISDENMEACLARLQARISKSAAYEICVTDDDHIMGYIDCIDGDNVYEFKCVQSLTELHYIQVVMYMYLHRHQQTSNQKYNYYLFNILTNELVLIDVTDEHLKIIIELIKNYKLSAQNTNEFIENNTKIKNIEIQRHQHGIF